MAAQFIGLHMRVVLREPPGHQLTGTVRDVEAGVGLTLTNVFITATKEWFPQLRIDAVNIADLSEITSDGPPKPVLQQPQPPPPPQPPTQPAFVDPAILSLGKRPKSTSSGNHSASDRNVAATETRASRPGSLYSGQAGRQPDRVEGQEAVVESMKKVSIDEPDDAHDREAKAVHDASVPKKRTKPRQRSQKDRRQAGSSSQPQLVETAQGSHGKGWRQTPILESTASFQPFNSLKRMGKKEKSSMDNGWASEDVTEEMGEFDFANNLAKFDKRTIFDQMRKEDQVEESSRLVSHNRRAKPGTAGGKNLHYTENVLEMPSSTAAGADFWNSEADVGMNGGEKLSGRESGTRRVDSSKGGGTWRSQSLKTTTMASGAGSQPMSRVNSSVCHKRQRSSRGVGRGRTSTDYYEQQGRRQRGLYLQPSMRRLEAITSLQMLNVENIAANEMGFSESLMAENAGRGIAEVAVTALSEPAIKVRFQLAEGTTLPSSTIVILAGNNKSSIRALAAGRHLRNRNLDVVVCLVGMERERDLLEDLRRQITLYRNFGGKVLGKNDFFESLRKGTCVSLIIDALLGLTMSFEELRIGDQASVYELMEWANRNEAYVLAVDVPSGIEPTSGKVAIIDGGHLFVKPRYVVAMGAPKKGLLEAVTPATDKDPQFSSASSENSAEEDGWRLFVADLGLGSAVWRRAGTKMRRGIEFEGKWVLEMRYRGEDESDSE